MRAADVVAHFAKAGHASHARAIAADRLRPGVPELALLYPVTTELPKDAPAYCGRIGAFYDGCAAALAAHLDAAALGRGDLRRRSAVLRVLHAPARAAWPAAIATEVIAGVTGMSGCWSALGAPIAQGDDVFTVLPATLR